MNRHETIDSNIEVNSKIRGVVEGNKGCVIADRFGVTPGRITRLRCMYEHLWRVFHGEAVGSPVAA